MNFRYKLMRFMSGRYGVDQMFYVLFALSILLAFINIFVRSFVLQLVVYAIVAYAMFRMFSRNIDARRRENKAIKNLALFLHNKRSIRRQRKLDYNHVYKKCPSCRAVLRLPRRKGKHTTICPKCNKKFKVYVFKA